MRKEKNTTFWLVVMWNTEVESMKVLFFFNFKAERAFLFIDWFLLALVELTFAR